MKYDSKLFVSRLDATRRALYLAYGTENPSPTHRPPRLLQYTTVAELMRVKPTFIYNLMRNYFNPSKPAAKRFSLQPPLLNTRPSKGARVTLTTIRDEEIEFLTSTDNLRAWSPFSLDWRCTLFHRRFNDRWIARHTLARLYRNLGIKKKAIIVKRVPQRKTQRMGEFEKKVVQLNQNVRQIVERGGHLVFIDESTFTARSFQMRAWA